MTGSSQLGPISLERDRTGVAPWYPFPAAGPFAAGRSMPSAPRTSCGLAVENRFRMAVGVPLVNAGPVLELYAKFPEPLAVGVIEFATPACTAAYVPSLIVKTLSLIVPPVVFVYSSAYFPVVWDELMNAPGVT